MKPQIYSLNYTGQILDLSCFSNQLLELTSREWEVLICIADDLTSNEIAERLSLTEKSVGNYRNRIGHKLNLNGVHNLARFARKHADELHLWHTQRCLLLGISDSR